MATTMDDLTTTLTDQHSHIKTLMEAVATNQATDRGSAFGELCRYLAAHEAAEEECIHATAKQELTDDESVVDARVTEEDEAGKAIAELEQLGTDAEHFLAKFEQLRSAVIAHAEAEEHQELPKLAGNVDETQLARMQHALSQVPDLAARNDQTGASFKDRLQTARAEFHPKA